MEADRSDDTVNAELASFILPNAFDLFCQKHRPILKNKFPNDDDRSIVSKLEEYWDVLEAKDKSVYNRLASDMKEHHAAIDKSPQIHRRPKNIIENSNNLSAAVVLAAASPIAPCWQKQRGQASSWQPSPILTQQLQQVKPPQPQPVSRNSSGSSSPEPSPNPNLGVANVAEAAPRKMFKQRYLANEHINQPLLSDVHGEQESSACEALLQLANVASRQVAINPAVSCSNTRSNSGTNSPKDSNDSSGGSSKGQGIEFNSLRDAVWSRVAQTILTQEKEKGNGCSSSDEPINLSNQCTIRGQTIIEHIIENILDEPMQQVNVPNCNGSSNPEGRESTDQIKDIIYQGLKDDIMNRAANNIQDGFKGRHALWNMLPNPRGPGPIPTTISNEAALQLLPTVPVPFEKEMTANGTLSNDTLEQPPTFSEASGSNSNPISIASSTHQHTDSDDQDKKARKGRGRQNSETKSPGSRVGKLSVVYDNQQPPAAVKPLRSPSKYSYDPKVHNFSIVYDDRQLPSMNSRPAPKQTKASRQKHKPHKFDVEQQLNAIPAFDLELFQQKMLNNGSSTASSLPSKRPASFSDNQTASPKKKV